MVSDILGQPVSTVQQGVSDRIRDSPSMPDPVRLAFLGCGFITDVHSRHLKGLGTDSDLQLRQPRRGESRRVLPQAQRGRQLCGVPPGDQRSRHRCGRRRRAAAVSSRADARRAGGGEARAGGEARVPAARRLRHRARGPGPRRSRRARRRERSLQAARRHLEAARRGGRDRRDGVRAFHDPGASLEGSR